MEKEQIIKALECCVSCTSGEACNGCPFNENGLCDNDTNAIEKYALALIKELTEKVEAYRQELGKVRVALTDANVDNKRLTEENERLSTALANYDRQTEVRIAEEYYTAEAYDELREENEKLRNAKYIYATVDYCADDLANALEENERLKADTVREFAERVKSQTRKLFSGVDVCMIVDRIADEILNKNTEEEKK
jgi:regulator of replication initiation timing